MRKSTLFFLLIIDEVLIVAFFIFLSIYYNLNIQIAVILTIVLVIIVGFIAYIFLPQLKKPVTGVEGMIGLSGITLETLEPAGKVKIKGEIWNAESINGKINEGDKIVVEKVNHLKLVVKKIDKI
jgi:membrane-bound serine protease (ClpP class)